MMGIHCELRDHFGGRVKNEPLVFLLESLCSAVMAANPQASLPAWQDMQELTQQLAELHQQEMQLDQELTGAVSTEVEIREGNQLLGELLASAPKAVLEAQADPAGLTARVVPAQWLRWWKDSRSWSAGYTFGQWLQDNAAGGGHSKATPAAAPTQQSSCEWLNGRRPANVTQAVVWWLQTRKVTAQDCEAAAAAVHTLQTKLAATQQQQEQAYKQLLEGWKGVLMDSWGLTGPQQDPVVVQLNISPDAARAHAMQQQLAASQAQLAAALQAAAAARARAELAAAKLQQQQQPVAVVLTVQQPSISLNVTVQEEAAAARQQDRGNCVEALQQRLAAAEAELEAHKQQQQQLLGLPQRERQAGAMGLAHKPQQQQQHWRPAGWPMLGPEPFAEAAAAAELHDESMPEQQPITPQAGGVTGQQPLPSPALRALAASPGVSSSSCCGSSVSCPDTNGADPQQDIAAAGPAAVDPQLQQANVYDADVQPAGKLRPAPHSAAADARSAVSDQQGGAPQLACQAESTASSRGSISSRQLDGMEADADWAANPDAVKSPQRHDQQQQQQRDHLWAGHVLCGAVAKATHGPLPGAADGVMTVSRPVTDSQAASRDRSKPGAADGVRTASRPVSRPVSQAASRDCSKGGVLALLCGMASSQACGAGAAEHIVVKSSGQQHGSGGLSGVSGHFTLLAPLPPTAAVMGASVYTRALTIQLKKRSTSPASSP